MASILSLALIIGLIPSGLAGPACVEKYKANATNCVAICGARFGIPGMMMGMDPWGSVMQATGLDMNAYVAKACGMPENATTTAAQASTTSTASTQLVHQGLGTQSVVQAAAPAPTTSSSSSSSSSRFSSSRRTTSTSTTHSTTSTTSTTKAATTSTTKQVLKATAPPATTHTTQAAAATHTTAASSNSNSNSNSNPNSNSNSNSGSSNTGSSSSSSGSGSNGSRASNSDVQTYLQTHNSIRSQHGAVPVTWSNAAAEKAQEWADECKNQHSGGTLGPLGENLAAGTGSFSITDAVKAWTDEVSEYNANNPQPSHFTQVVWKATTEIGCAVQTCDGIFAGFGAAQYYVCEYSVQGNVIGNFAANVQA